MYAIGAAVLFIVVVSFFLGTDEMGGRLTLSEGVLANPNDLAQILLVGMPGILLIGMSGGFARRAFTAAAALLILFVTMKTGSRGAIVVLFGLFVILLWSLSWSGKFKVLLGACLIVLSLLPFTSEEQWYRYSTILGSDPKVSDEAVNSRESRRELLEQSIYLTFTHPLFGVGPGVFDVASNAYSQARGERGIWHNPHNSYTQVSSEAGLPAFICYVAVLVTCMRTSRRVYQTAKRDGYVEFASVAYCLWLSFTIFAISTLFSSVAYHSYLPMLAGLTVALDLCSLQLVQKSPAEAHRPPLRTVNFPIPSVARAHAASRNSSTD